jgi:hypothetical protein
LRNGEAVCAHHRFGAAVAAGGEQFERTRTIRTAGAQSLTDSDHDPWRDVTKDFLPSDTMGKRPIYRLAAWLYKVNYNLAIARPQYTRRNFDNPREGGRVANRPGAFRTMPHIRPEVLCPPKHTCQRLALLRTKLVVEALLVQRAVGGDN